LSILYAVLYDAQKVGATGGTTIREDSSSSYFQGGFCVTGLDQKQGTCSAAAGNSHEFAFGIDVLYTLLAIALPFTGLCQTNPVSLWFVLNAVVLAAVIGGHGMLHKLLSENSCQGGGGLGDLYALYIFALMAVDLLGFSSIPSMTNKNGVLLALVVAAVLTVIIYVLTDVASSVTGFFLVSQVVVSVTGLAFPNPKTVTPQLGWAFALPIIVSLVEFLKCDAVLVRYGGHSWYDFFLHLALLVSIVYGEFVFPPWKK